MPIGPGTKLGSYIVQDSIGQGAMGVVYRAYHAQLERSAAVKVLQALSPDTDTVARFRREAQSIGHMRHPNVLNVFDFGEFEGTPYMIVEYVEGGSLANVVKSGPLDRKAMLGYLRGVASALDYAHSLGIVHRDVKPANVLLGSHDTPILADFGLAKLMESASIKSLTGVTTGTPAYMAPEQVVGSQVGPAADRYSLVVMAYEMLTGFLPFDEGGVLEVLYAQVHRVPDPPSLHSSRLGPLVDAVIMRGLAKDPTARWQSCEAFVTALEDALNRKSAVVEKTIAFAPPVSTAAARVRPIHAQPRIDQTEVVRAPASAIRGPDAAIVKHPPHHRRRMFIYAGIAAVLLILVLLLGTTAFLVFAGPTTLSVSNSTVSPGDVIDVTATHVPRNQAGELQLHSVLQTYPFRADALGKVRGTIFLPIDLELGYHRLAICWNGGCHAEVALNVVGRGVADVSPGSSPTPGASATPGTSATPGSSPHPTASPTHSTTTSPTPRTTPSSSPKPAIVITPTTVHILISRDITVSGSYWPAGSKVTITFTQVNVVTQQIGSQNVQSNGSFSWTGGIPSSAVPGTSATITVCDGAVCKSGTISVTT